MRNTTKHICILGTGAWGAALGYVSLHTGLTPIFWSRSPESFAKLPEHVREKSLWCSQLEEALSSASLVLITLPSQTIRHYAPTFSDYKKTDFVICSKGLDRISGAFLSDIIGTYVLQERIFVLSGPSFSQDVLAHLPTAVCLAGQSLKRAQALARQLSSPVFRIYSSSDRIGVQVGGAIKNVLAIACGISDGKNLGSSARAALMTRAFSELLKIGQVLGAKKRTLSGLSGLGDLILTGSSALSRNYALGQALAQASSYEEALKQREDKGVCEGVFAAQAIVKLADIHGLDLPICRAVFSILSQKSSPEQEIKTLLMRPLKAE